MNENCFRSFSLDQLWVLHDKFLCDSRDWAIFGRYNLRFARVRLNCLVHQGVALTGGIFFWRFSTHLDYNLEDKIVRKVKHATGGFPSEVHNSGLRSV